MISTLTRVALALAAVVAVLLGLLALLIYNELYDSETLRYRLTYEVEIDGEIRSGSGVVQVRVWERPKSLGTSGVGFDVTGEAVIVDLGNGRYLFSLLSGRAVRTSSWGGHVTTPDKLIWLAFDGQSSDIPDSYDFLNRTRPSVELPFRILPALATFGDIDDRNSIRLVEPDDLATHFGTGTVLRRVTMEVTGDPVTDGRIEEILPWLDDWQGWVNTPEKSFSRYSFVQSY